jgi:hypothetical protein
MDRDPIHEAELLAHAIAQMLQRAAAVLRESPERSDIRYAEALARTLSAHLETMRRSDAA